MGRKANIFVRNSFTLEQNGNKTFNVCKSCGKKIAGNWLTNLRKHLIDKHYTFYESLQQEQDEYQSMSAASYKKRKIQIELSVEEVTNACVDLVTIEGRPFTTLDSKPFRTLIQPIFAGLGMDVINSHSIVNIIDEKYEDLKQQITRPCAKKLISLKIDVATRCGRSIFGVNMQYVDIKTKKIVIKTLGMVELHVRHNSENLKLEVLKILKKYNISVDQIHTITTDNGQNMIKTVRILREAAINDLPRIISDNDKDDLNDEVFNDFKVGNISSIRCAAHTLHLAVNDFLRNTNIESVINKARDLVKLLRTPNHKINLSQKNLKKPFIDVVTRWNSTYNMLERLLTLKDYCENESNCKKIVHSIDWVTISEVIKVLAPVKEASLKVQEVQLPLGDFVKLWWELKLNVKSMQFSYSILLSEILENREQLLIENDTLLSSIFLDPRLRKLLSLEKIDRAKINLRKLCTQLLTIKKLSQSQITESNRLASTSIRQNIHESCSSSNNNDNDNNNTTASTTNFSKYLDEIDISSGSSNEESEVKSELQAALYEIEMYNSKRVDLNINILEYWIDRRFKNPFLSQLAVALHNVPATQVSVERAFSALKFILNDLRTSINENTLENILLLKLNAEH